MATQLSGKIISITASTGGTSIKLDNDPSIGPKDNYWNLLSDHTNYNGMYSLAIAAAANRWTLQVWPATGAEINPNEEATIKKLRVVW